MYRRLRTAEVSTHKSIDDAWVIVDGAVYDVTSFLKSHPGGVSVTEEHLGQDISNVIRSDEVHRHSSTAYKLLELYKIGELKDEEVTKITPIFASQLYQDFFPQEVGMKSDGRHSGEKVL